MKIVFLIRSLTYGGAERQLVALARGLHARGHEIEVGVFYAGGPLQAELDAAGVPVTVLDKRGRWDVAPFLVRLVAFLRRARPDIVHGYLGTSNYLGVLTRPFHGAPVVWGLRSSEVQGERYDWFYRLDAGIERWLSRFPDLIIANSRAGLDHAVRHGYPASRSIVIPNGIDTARFRPDTTLRTACRAELGIDAATPLIGRVGRLDPQKDYPTFLRAAAAIAGRRSDARFLIVGSGPDAYARELDALGADLDIGDRVTRLDARNDMPAVFNALDVLVSSSAYGEGTPNVVAEAMACGVPCVVTDSGDSRWVVGETGAVVMPGDVHALARATLDLLDDFDHDRVDGAAIRRLVVDHLSLDALIARTEAALEPVVAARRMERAV